MPRLNNLSQLKKRRSQLRDGTTEAEKCLWLRIRYNRLGHKFRRQFSVGPYVLDFYCPEKKLAIELDGSQHNEKLKKVYDRERTEYLKSLGIYVLRFWNDDVSRKTSEVLEIIHERLNT